MKKQYFSRVVVSAIFLTSVWFGFQPLPAEACSCMPPRPPEEALNDAAAVFSGTVVSVKEAPSQGAFDSLDPVQVSFDVKESWKGVSNKTVTVRTGDNSAACGYEFTEGQDYLIYAYGSEGELGTGLCTRTARLADASEDLAALGTSTVDIPTTPSTPLPPVSVTQTPMSFIVLGVVLVLIIALAMVVVMKYMDRKE